MKVISKEGLKRTRIRHKNVDNEIFMEKQALRRLNGQRCAHAQRFSMREMRGRVVHIGAVFVAVVVVAGFTNVITAGCDRCGGGGGGGGGGDVDVWW